MLLTLPAEIQTAILRMVLGDWDIYIDHWPECSVQHAKRTKSCRQWKDDSLIFADCRIDALPLSHVCRLLRSDAIALVGKCARLDFDRYHLQESSDSFVCGKPLPAFFREEMRHVRIHVDEVACSVRFLLELLALESLRTVTLHCGIVDFGEYFRLPGPTDSRDTLRRETTLQMLDKATTMAPEGRWVDLLLQAQEFPGDGRRWR
jgi:hypothetical protein